MQCVRVKRLLKLLIIFFISTCADFMDIIKQPHDDVLVDQRQSFAIFCKESEPITWTFTSAKTNISKSITNGITTYEFHDGKRSYGSLLEITNATLDDIGFYRCFSNRKENSNIFISVNDYINVTLPIVNPFGDVIEQSGRNITIHCKGNKPLMWISFRDEEILIQNSSLHYKTNDDNFPYGSDLKLSNISSENRGLYNCIYNNTRDLRSLRLLKLYIFRDTFNINIIEKNLNADDIKMFPYEDMIISPGENLTLICKSRQPFIWVFTELHTNHGESVIIDDTLQNKSENENIYDSKLKLINVTSENSGYYTCISNDSYLAFLNESNFLEFLKRKIFFNNILLIVADSDSSMSVYTYPVQMIVEEFGKNVMIQCKGKKPLIWTFSKIFNSDNVNEKQSISYETNDIHNPYGLLLRLPKLKMSDVGFYTCLFKDYFSEFRNHPRYLHILYKIGHARFVNILAYYGESFYKNGLQIYPETKFIISTESNLTIKCEGRNPILWFFTDINKTNSLVIKTETKAVDSLYFDRPFGSLLKIPNVTTSNTGYYTCVLDDSFQDFRNGTYSLDILDRKHVSKTIFVLIKDAEKPYIIKSSITNKTINASNNKNISFYCEIEGFPKPELHWLKDNYSILPNERIEFLKNNLSFKYITKEDVGYYECVGINRAGKIRKGSHLIVNDMPFNPLYIAVILFLIIIFIFFAFILLIINMKQKERKMLLDLGLLSLKKGVIENLNPHMGIAEQTELLSYNKKWEFPRKKLILEEQIGSGAFGIVMKATAFGIIPGEEMTTVAVKLVRKPSDISAFKALASELKIMIHLGKHLNVVNILGACTKTITKRELLVIVEYCRFGNLRDFLLRNRQNFINQVDQSNSNIDDQIGLAMKNHSDGNENQSNISKIASERSSDEFTSIENDIQNPLLGYNYYDYCTDYQTITTQNLLGWSFQIARGMQYLASRKIFHGDLAARNILLADDSIVKICDFGLAKNMYEHFDYKKNETGPLPIKWMAIELLKDGIFSSQSDVWSFGIVMWELFSLGATPYPKLNINKEFFENLFEGYRMEMPKYATKKIYNTMMKCWQENPDKRPNFTELIDILGDFLEDTVRQHYVDLNDPYLDMNNRMLSENDYLPIINSSNCDVSLSKTTKCNDNCESILTNIDTIEDIEVISLSDVKFTKTG